jgi:hypothetical protein
MELPDIGELWTDGVSPFVVVGLRKITSGCDADDSFVVLQVLDEEGLNEITASWVTDNCQRLG